MQCGTLPTLARESTLGSHCPYLTHAAADWSLPVEGCCRARAGGRPMAPAVPHYLQLCATADYRLCDAFRARTPAPGDFVTA